MAELPLTCPSPALWHRDGCWGHPHLWELHSILRMLPSYLWLNLPFPLSSVSWLCPMDAFLAPLSLLVLPHLLASLGECEISTRQEQQIPGRNFHSPRQNPPSCLAEQSQSVPIPALWGFSRQRCPAGCSTRSSARSRRRRSRGRGVCQTFYSPPGKSGFIFPVTLTH